MGHLRSFLILLTLLLPALCTTAQSIPEGRLLDHNFTAPSITGNKGGEDSIRRISIYLPPGYDETVHRYPTIYLLHGFADDDHFMSRYLGLKQLMDQAIASGQIRPVILVLPNSNTRFKGSFYANSAVTGNWADFIGKDVVQYTDRNFRTIADKNGRGLAGHSMGGTGVLRIAMLYADVFGAAYALSPGALHLAKEFNLDNPAFKRIAAAKTSADIFVGFDNPENTDNTTFFTVLFTALARTYSPDEKSMPLQAQFPVTYDDNVMTIHQDVVRQWEANFPINMIPNYVTALQSLNALKIDWGRNDQFPHIPATCRAFSEKLETYNIKHFAEEYLGDHVNKLGGVEGRIYTDMLPFFQHHLTFPVLAPEPAVVHKKKRS
ncbi:MAG TPA: alpha/beta hydrolase-fold protein [Ohtaekwangia sp.]|nr:alpha/beta hydrolase-fold protein [Ohtaekwangia sp.]